MNATCPDDRRFFAALVTFATLLATLILVLLFGEPLINTIFGAIQ